MKVDHSYFQIKRNQLLPGLGLWCHSVFCWLFADYSVLCWFLRAELIRVTVSCWRHLCHAILTLSSVGELAWWGVVRPCLYALLFLVYFLSNLQVAFNSAFLLGLAPFWICAKIFHKETSVDSVTDYTMHWCFHNVLGTHCKKLASSF